MRDLERWKDKVELSLDGRQIFFLFFGSAVAACLVFVVGVLVGKRMEARALAMQPPPVEDPLAALDQLGEADEPDDSLTFHKALTREVGKKAASAPKDKEPPRKLEPPKEKLEALREKSDAQSKETELPKPPKAEASTDGKIADVDGHPKMEVAPLKPMPVTKAQVVAAAPAKKDGKKTDSMATHFTLQLSAFPERSDAEEFMKKMQVAGYRPFVIASEIPGKGVFYRVRVGDYISRQSALEAKTEFERKQRLIAYVAKL